MTEPTFKIILPEDPPVHPKHRTMGDTTLLQGDKIQFEPIKFRAASDPAGRLDEGTTATASFPPRANPLNYELVVQDHRGKTVREHSMSCPHTHGERYTTLLCLQKLQEKILLEANEDDVALRGPQ